MVPWNIFREERFEFNFREPRASMVLVDLVFKQIRQGMAVDRWIDRWIYRWIDIWMDR